MFSGQGEFNDGEFSFQFRGEDHTAAQENQGFGFCLGLLQHVFELADEDGVGVLEEQVEVAEENYGLLLHISDGNQGFKWVVGGVVGTLFHIHEAIHHRPEDEVVFEFLGDLVNFCFDSLFFLGYEIKPWLSGSYVVYEFVFHFRLFSFLVDVDDCV